MARAIETVHAYAAGLIDGEGCISIGSHRRKTANGVMVDYYLAVIVVTKDEHLTRWLYGNYGGTVNVVTRGGYKRTGVYKRWVVHSTRAQVLLKKILPYLILKKDQARTGIQFQNCKRRNRGKPDRGREEELYLRMRLQKRASVEAKPSGPFLGKACDGPALRVIGDR